MQNRKLHLYNFCQHADLTVEFPPGKVIGILGGNGRGKSNLIKGMRFAYIGESGNEGAKVEDLNWQAAADGEPGFVELEFDVAGQPGTIKRAVNTTRTSLKFGSGKALTGANPVTARVLDISTVSKRVMESIIFVMQGKLEEILFERPSERAKKLQGLFGIENVEKLRQLLHQEAALITTDPTDDRIKELQKQLDEEIDPQLRELNDSRAKHEAFLAAEDQEELESLRKRYEQYVADLNRRTDLVAQQEKLRTAIHARGDIAAVETRGVELRHQYEEMRKQIDQSNVALASAGARAHLRRELERCQAVMAEEAPTAPPVSWDQVNEGRRQVAVEREQIERTQRYLELFTQGKTGPCELCGQTLQFTNERVSEAHAYLLTQPSKLADVEQIIANSVKLLETYDAARARWHERHTEASNQLARLQEEVAKDEGREIPDVNEAELNTLIQRHDVVSAELAQIDKQLAEHREHDARDRALLASVDSQLAELNFEAPCSEGRYNAVLSTLQARIQSQMEVSGIDGQLQQLHTTRMRILAELEGLKQQAGSMEAKRTYKGLCVKAREVLHRDVLPQYVMRQYLSALNAELDKYLQIFNVPFSCAITDEMDVICRIDGFPDKPAGRLSGGQRIMLSIAFRFAIYNLFASKLGFVILDEPTPWLDGHHVGVIADMLSTVRSYVLNAGLQLIVITHREELIPVFDHIIRL